MVSFQRTTTGKIHLYTLRCKTRGRACHQLPASYPTAETLGKARVSILRVDNRGGGTPSVWSALCRGRTPARPAPFKRSLKFCGASRGRRALRYLFIISYFPEKQKRASQFCPAPFNQVDIRLYPRPCSPGFYRVCRWYWSKQIRPFATSALYRH